VVFEAMRRSYPNDAWIQEASETLENVCQRRLQTRMLRHTNLDLTMQYVAEMAQ
jgi:hypothetical protein